MKRDHIESLPLVARGGQADIYDCGNGRIIRVPRRPQDYDRIRYEYAVYSLLSGSTVVAPRAYELVDVDGAPSIIMERIPGISMMEQIRKKPLTFRRQAVGLARMHLGLLKVSAESTLTSSRKQAHHCIGNSRSLPGGVKRALMEVLEQLPDGDFLCHGDFHPGNILHSGGRDYIIDWSGATKGNIGYDIAHTYILLRVVPRAPGISLLLYAVQKLLGKAMARIYLKTVLKSVSLPPGQLSLWVLIKAAERTYYGLPSEMKRLHTFINRSVQAKAAGNTTGEFYRWI